MNDLNDINNRGTGDDQIEDSTARTPYQDMVQPMNYWEEVSFFEVIPGSCPVTVDESLAERIRLIQGVEIVEWKLSEEDQKAQAVLTYREEEYEVRFSRIPMEPSALEDAMHLIPEEDQEWCKNVTEALVISMRFGKIPQRSYHLQLKLAAVSVPDFVLLMDESAERFFSGRWVNMTALSELVPAFSNLYTISAVADEERSTVWLHTHGLCRCGLSEIEVLGSGAEEYSSHADLIRGVAQYMVDHTEDELYDCPLLVGTFQGGKPIVVTLIPWPEALTYYEGISIGGPESRQEDHNTFSSVIFIYQNQKEEDLRKFHKVNVYDGMWGDDPIFYVSQRETIRMSALARERFEIARNAFEKGQNVMIKIGLMADEEHQNDDGDLREHIWFDLTELLPEGRFRARLTQTPFWIEKMKVGDCGEYGTDQITDWIVEKDEMYVSPENAYVLTE